MYGIDLGTTNSVIAIIDENGNPKVIENKNGKRITPSAVLFVDDDTEEIVVGENAKKQYSMNPSHTILSVKRLMGTSQKIEIGSKSYTPEQISAKILRKLVDDANERLNKNINQVVITVPAYFDDRQRNATKQAGEIAGLEVLRIINEPTAAALSYGLDQREPRTICVYDFGGGTFDVSILTIGENICEVNATSGNTQLGGDDLDKEIEKWLVNLFQRDHGIDLSDQPLAISRIKEEAEKAKIELSETSSVNIVIPFITNGENGPLNLQYTLTQKEFAEMSENIIQQTLDCVKSALEDAGMTTFDIAEILLVGGSTRVPMVQDAIETFFGKTPNRNINPDEVVAVGASVNAGIIGGVIENIILADVTPLTLSVEVEGGLSEPMIRRNTTIPTSHSQSFTTHEDGQTSVTVHITQGERVEASKNRSLGKFVLDEIIPAPAGVPNIKVSFDIDVNGILSVSAKDMVTEKEKSITITEGESFTAEELKNMIEDGKKFAEEDKIKRQLIEFKNVAERLIYQSNKTLEEYKSELPEEVVDEINQSIKNTEDNLNVQNPDVIKESIAQLKEDILSIGKYLYKKGEE